MSIKLVKLPNEISITLRLYIHIFKIIINYIINGTIVVLL